MNDQNSPDLPESIMLRNEFSMVELSYIVRGDSLSLCVRDALSGEQIVLDSTELECLVRAPHESFRRLLLEIDETYDGIHLAHDDPTVEASNGQEQNGHH